MTPAPSAMPAPTPAPSATFASTPSTALLSPPTPPARPAPLITRDELAKAPGDHESVVHHIAVGYLGASQIPIAQPATTGIAQGFVTAPVLGVRYWIGARAGFDIGLGFGFSTASTSQTAGGVTNGSDTPPVVGFAIHGGVPLALAYSKHFTFEIIPEIDFGFAGTHIPGLGVADTGLNGIRFGVGGRIGAEVQFGFIGIPQLSLQGSIGLSIRYDKVWASQASNTMNASSLAIGTTLQNDPWAIFTNSVSALYYF